MANTFQHYRTSVAGRLPAAADISEGELVINTADKCLYTKDASGNVIQIGGIGYTKSEATGRYVTQATIPFSRFGDLTTAPLPITFSGLTLSINAAIPVFIQGTLASIAPQTIKVDASAGTSYVLLYVRLANGVVSLVTATSTQPETSAMMFVGTITVSSSITSIAINKTSRIDQYRPSATQQGSSIPVSTGTADTSGSLTW